MPTDLRTDTFVSNLMGYIWHDNMLEAIEYVKSNRNAPALLIRARKVLDELVMSQNTRDASHYGVAIGLIELASAISSRRRA